jgi:ABC-2 type transport system ATP-binding protein
MRDQVELLRDQRRGVSGRGWRWALRDVDFTVAPGESIGLVGANGSGKSTLLKILTRVMYPYAGSVDVRGRAGALIEVRAGIHPELTGRENVYLYGSLLGLRRRAVVDRFDAIVDFAQLPKAIDRPVKFYSTGMQMRLGFAVAAFLEPDVLLVDEVLAVGDAAFQQRCLERMRQVLADGTTLVLVSHDLASIEAMCGRGLWLADGLLRADGPVRDVLGAYRRSIEEVAEDGLYADGKVRVRKAEVVRADGFMPTTLAPLQVTLALETAEGQAGRLYLGVSEGGATPIFLVSTYAELAPGCSTVTCTVDGLPLPRGRYSLWIAMLARKTNADLMAWHPTASFDVLGPDLDPAPRAVVRPAPVHVRASWAGDGLS